MKRVAVLLAEGFEEIEALTVVDIMRRAKVNCDMVSLEKLSVIGAHNIEVKCDKVISDNIKEYDLIVMPGGMPGSVNLKNSEKVINAVKYFNENNKLMGVICAAPIVLAAADVISGRNVTSYPEIKEELKGCNYKEDEVVVDGNIITSRGPATAMSFSYKLLEVLGYDNYKEISKAMLYKLY
ncbi:DJ-1 family glyoxalase III [Clostridium vincentii]|uniref:Putative cysteine protease YraA n=1 Tax=Clostridium vincentii TaxID=52704 RepID=A0A2T0BG62_9CLOT|nr:DJ-1 family glyoxalase III [Clostridium vincentii]PRR82812.1 putative cysteine protease YraA [Clostridium vincentii]